MTLHFDLLTTQPRLDQADISDGLHFMCLFVVNAIRCYRAVGQTDGRK